MLSIAGLLAVPATAAAAPNLFVGNPFGFATDTVSLFDIEPGGTLTPKDPATADSASRPTGLAVSPDGDSLYATNFSATTVSQYDIAPQGGLAPKSPAATVPSGTSPQQIIVSPNGESAYVTNRGTADVSQYDVASNGALSPKIPEATVDAGGQPWGLAISPDGGSVYVGNAGDDDVSQYDVDPDTGALTPKTTPTVPDVIFPTSIALTPDGGSAYVTRGGTAGEIVYQFDVDPGDGTLSPKSDPTAPAGGGSSGIAISADGSSAYTANQFGDSVSQFDIDPDDGTLTPKDPASVSSGGSGAGPHSVVISPDGHSVYVSNNVADSVAQYDVSPTDGTLAAKDPASVTAFRAAGMAVRPDTVGPTTSISGGPSGTVGTRGANFSFTADEPSSTFECRLDSAAFSPCDSPRLFTGLADGPHAFRVRATDLLGNIGPTATRTWTIDTTPAPEGDTDPPETTIDSGPKAKTKKRKATIEFSADEPGSTFECSLDGEDFAPCDSPFAQKVKRKRHAFEVVATDPSGNADPTPAEHRWKVKKKPS